MQKNNNKPKPTFPQKRVVSIDALRGFDMFWIISGESIMVSLAALIHPTLGEAVKYQLEHAEWNGFRFYDLIFPLFLFIVGVSLIFSLYKRVSRGDEKKHLIGHIVKRTCVLFFLGLVYNGLFGLNFDHFRFAGVLQRIALCYFFTSMIVLYTDWKWQAYIAGAILLLYWAAMALIPVPGYGAGVLTPEGNLSAFIDQKLLPGSFCCYKFGDNEGILSTLPAVATTLLGCLAGHWLRSERKRKVLWMLMSGVVLLATALLWDLLFPINKLLWSSSYVLFAAGWSVLLLALFYYIIDVRGWGKWAYVFVVIGLNPITIYVVQSQFDFYNVANIFIRGFIDHTGIVKPLLVALSVFAAKWLFLYFLHRKKIYLKA
ncbi:DUF5009 domain-containing protein [candidate division KSB1 bacterium]|nr:DUF5009 domain-containing protein [candidate division KSB1 bacterium]